MKYDKVPGGNSGLSLAFFISLTGLIVIITGATTLGAAVENTDTGNTFSTIQAAIDDSDTDAGDTIVISSTYDSSEESFPITIHKELTLQESEDDPEPFVTAQNSDATSVIEISASGVTLQGLTVEAEAVDGTNGVQNAIIIDGSDNVTLDGLTVSNVDSSSNEASGVKASGALSGFTLKNSTVESVTSDSGESYGVFLDGVEGEISHNSITENGDYGIYITETGVSVRNNTISGNGLYGLYFDSAGELDAKHNYWGDRRGPRESDYDPGTGDKVSDNVSYDPWLVNRNATRFTEGTVSLEIGGDYEGDAYGLEAEANFGDTESSVHPAATLSIAAYESNPTASYPEVRNSDFMDLYFASEGTPDSVNMAAECTTGNCYANVLRWFDGSNWEMIEANKNEGVLEANFTDSSSPAISDLTGTKFVIGSIAPYASFGSLPSNPEKGEEITFDATDSYDPDKSIEEYRWDWDDDGNYEESSSDPIVTHSYSTGGTHTTNLEVEDEDDYVNETSRAIHVNADPVPEFSVIPEEPHVEKEASFDASRSSDPDGTIKSYEWSFGDGSTGEGEKVTHTYENDGTFTVKLTATDDDGGSASTTREIAVSYEKEYVRVENPGWSMVSAPIDPAEEAPASVFSGLDNPNMIYHWAPGAERFLTPTTGYEKVKPFLGSWVYLEEDEAPKLFTIRGVYDGSVEINLEEPGWHQVGLPMEYGWDDLGVNAGNKDTRTIGEQASGPSAPHWLSRFIWEWDRQEEEYIAHDARNSDFTLTPGKAYWVRTRKENVNLVVPFSSPPPTPSEAASRSDGISMNSNRAERLDIPSPPAPPTAYSVGEFNVNATPNPISGQEQVTFLAKGSSVNAFQIKVYGPAGNLIHESDRIRGHTYTWKPKSIPSNGIFLYSVSVSGDDGEKFTETGKLLVLS